jgi:hypothetical protein
MALHRQGFSRVPTQFTTCVAPQHPKGNPGARELCLTSAMILPSGLLLRALVLGPVLLKSPKDSDITVLDAAPTTHQALLLVDVGRRLIVLVATLRALPQSLLFTVKRVAWMIHLCLRRRALHVEMRRNPQAGASLRTRRAPSTRALRRPRLLSLHHSPTPLCKGGMSETPKSQSLLRMHKLSFYRVPVYSWPS